MGAYSGKFLTVYISSTGVRIAEGENRGGNPNIARFFTVPAVEEYFAEIPGSAGVYEVTNMSGLVDAIVEECAQQRTSSKRVMISTNCLGIDTRVSTEASKARDLASLLSSDLGGGGGGKNKRGAKTKDHVALGTLQCKVGWGDMIQDGKAFRQVTTTVGEKYMLQSIAQEFFQRGYQIIGISDCIGTLMNFRQSEEATFDHKGKIIFDFDTSFSAIYLMKDLPVSIVQLSYMDSFELQDRIVQLVQDALEQVGRSPKIFITGSMMRDTQLYCQLIDRLESLGYAVYDLFDRPDVDPDTGLEPGTGRPVLTPDYAINIAMLMSAYAKNVVVLKPSVGFEVVFKRNSKALASVALLASIACFGVAAFFTVMTMFDIMDMESNPPRVDSLNSEIQSLQNNIAQAQATLDTLTQADVTVLDTINFVYSNQSPMISIISIDTRDMLNNIVVDSAGTVTVEETGEVVTGTATGMEHVPGKQRASIIIRGYARTYDAAVDFYNKLYNYGLPIDPTIKGIEEYTLPNGRDQVQIFEIEIGGATA